MNLFNPKSRQGHAPPQPQPPPPPLELLGQAFNSLQTHFSNFLHNSPIPNLKLPTPWASTSNSTVSAPSSFQTKKTISDTKARNAAMNLEEIEERLAGVPVYALSNSSEEFMLVSGSSSGKNLGLFCFNESDAQALLQEMQSMDPTMRKGSQVVAVALNKVFQLKVNGVAFRLIPEPSQVKNAIKARKIAGASDESFYGVPIFQSKSLVLRSQDKRYRPVFFRKEDLEKSLLRASRTQNVLNPAFRVGDVQVAVLEDIIQGMKTGSSAQWDDIVFIPPGYDVSTLQPQEPQPSMVPKR